MTYKEYGERMVRDGRFASISENGKIVLVMLYSVCNDPEPFINNIDHEYMEHDPNGKVLVIENIVGTFFHKRFVKAMEDIFYSKFPQIEKTMWRRGRFPIDKIVTYNRRHAHATQY